MTAGPGRVRVLVADDPTLVRQGLVSLLVDSGECEVVAEAADGLEAVEKAHATHPEVAVIDLTMPRLSGLEAVRRIHAELPRVRILVLTAHEEEEYVLALALPATWSRTAPSASCSRRCARCTPAMAISTRGRRGCSPSATAIRRAPRRTPTAASRRASARSSTW